MRRSGWLAAGMVGAAFGLLLIGIPAAIAACFTPKHGDLSSAISFVVVVIAFSVVGALIVGTQLPLRLPDGRLPSPGWRWYSRLTIVLTGVAWFGTAAQPHIYDVRGTSNPLHMAWAQPLAALILVVIAWFVAGSWPWLDAPGAHERAQLRSVAYGGAVFVSVV